MVVVGQGGGIRKAKRVSDVAAMGAPSPSPAFSPAPAYNAGFQPAGPPPPHQEGIQLDASQDFSSAAPPPGSKFQLITTHFYTTLASYNLSWIDESALIRQLLLLYWLKLWLWQLNLIGVTREVSTHSQQY